MRLRIASMLAIGAAAGLLVFLVCTPHEALQAAQVTASPETPDDTWVTGQVTDTSGKAIEGVWVELASSEGVQASIPVQCDPEGRFSIHDIAPGRYLFYVSCMQDTTLYRLPAQNRACTLRENEPIENVNVRIPNPEKSVIAGNVKDSISDAPVEGVQVALVGGANGIFAKTTTNAKGDFRLIGLPEGKLALSFTHEEYQEGHLTGMEPSNKKLQVHVIKLGSISGQVCKSYSKKPFDDFHSCVLELTRNDGADGSTGVPKCDLGDGRFQITHLEPGVAKISVASFGYVTQELPDITITSGEDTDLGIIYLDGFGRIEGYVTMNGVPLKDDAVKDGIPLAKHVKVSITQLDPDGNVRSKRIANPNILTDGSFTIENLSAALYQVQAEYTFSDVHVVAQTTSVNCMIVNVPPGETVRANIDIMGSCGIRGTYTKVSDFSYIVRVYKAGTAPTIWVDNTESAGNGNDNGLVARTWCPVGENQYEILNLPPGEYDVIGFCSCGLGCTIPGVTYDPEPICQRVTLRNGQIAELNFDFSFVLPPDQQIEELKKSGAIPAN